MNLNFIFLKFFLYIVIFFIIFSFNYTQAAKEVPTYIYVTICNDGIINPGEVCDDGQGNNTGGYGSSIQNRVCNSTCSGWGPYCGDNILQVLHGEECDDGNNDSGDFCSETCEEEQASSPAAPVPAGNIPSISAPKGNLNSSFPTKVIIKGKAYPNSDVNILLDGEVISVIKADTNADFTFSTTNITPGISTFGFWAKDKRDLRSIAFTATFEIIDNAVTTVAGVFLPPTIELSNSELKSGELLNINGQSIPEVKVYTHVNSEEEIIIEASANEQGDWGAQVDTAALESDSFHTAKAYFELEKLEAGTIQSGFSRAVSFFVGEKKPVEDIISADLNGDGKVNLIDFSIFLIRWGSDDAQADFDENGIVNLFDFSILLFYWTG